MSVTGAFDEYQLVVNADIEQVREARRRRDLFRTSFGQLDDVLEVMPSGSLARGTHRDPIHDVDVVVVFDGDAFPTWGSPGASAADALDHTRGLVNDLLGATSGTDDTAVRLARWHNHAVKCFFDDPEDPDGFTVDAMPALRRDGRLLIPEALSRAWVPSDPEHLINAVAAKHSEWGKYAGTVRMLKAWAGEQDFRIKSLVMEVLALDYLPTGTNRPAAIKQFFVGASYFIEGGSQVVDPAGLCGPIQPGLDYERLALALRTARDNATRAFQAQANNDPTTALHHWQSVFGDGFPTPPEPVGTVTPAVVATPRPVKDSPQGC